MIRHRFGGNLRADRADSVSSSVTHLPLSSVNCRQPRRLRGVEEPAAGRREAGGIAARMGRGGTDRSHRVAGTARLEEESE
jgi:hypothetical protein